jgi:hypothetical protein
MNSHSVIFDWVNFPTKFFRNMPDDVYTEHTLRSVHALFVDLNRQYITSNLVIDGKLW